MLDRGAEDEQNFGKNRIRWFIEYAPHFSRHLALLSGNNIGDEGAKCLAEALKTNISLNEISFEDNLFDTFISSEFFGHNNIGDDGARAFGEVFKTNKTLTNLNLNGRSLKPFVCLRLLFPGNKIDKHTMGGLNMMEKLYPASGSLNLSDSLNLSSIQNHVHRMCSPINFDRFLAW